MRALNIGLRTAHLAAMGILLGGHAFDVPSDDLLVILWLVIGTGIALAAAESGGKLLWFHQGRGIMTMAKLVLLCSVLVAWNYRVPILLGVVTIASVGSHMSGRFRYYSVVYRRVVHDGIGPGKRRAREEGDEIRGEEG